jgi:hypothetical protein
MDPKALEHIFATQGHHLTDEQLEQFIQHCRAERARIAAAEAAGKPVRKAKVEAVAGIPATASMPSLDDLMN